MYTIKDQSDVNLPLCLEQVEMTISTSHSKHHMWGGRLIKCRYLITSRVVGQTGV